MEVCFNQNYFRIFKYKFKKIKVMKKNVEVIEVKKLGRPVNVNSERQKRLKELEIKKEKGLLKKGRPVKEDSKRQLRLKELELKRNNGELKRGRPVNVNSERQIRLKELENKRELGLVKRGRPKKEASI